MFGNHHSRGLVVKSNNQQSGGADGVNHGLKVKTTVKGGTGGERCRPPCGVNHALKVKTTVKAGEGGTRCRPPCGVNHGLKVKGDAR